VGDNRFFSFPFPFPIPLNKHGTYAAGIFQLYNIYHTSAVALASSIIFSLARANWTRHISRHPLVLGGGDDGGGGGGGGPPKTSAAVVGGVRRVGAAAVRACLLWRHPLLYTHARTHTHTRPTHPHTVALGLYKYTHIMNTRRRRFIIIQYGRVPTTSVAPLLNTDTLCIKLYISHLYTSLACIPIQTICIHTHTHTFVHKSTTPVRYCNDSFTILQ